ncbi:hypothetical protein [Cellulomonas sp. URHD0024]|uniref:hypothetical protein n=1 Tax=Cellulomonas sp. URHD0024 TaxID=1302620 RepID=UPI0004002810|nr:hypothetical protein [Cellulomonas sp. URHD0024]
MSEDDAQPSVQATDADDTTQPVKDLLAEHVPLALLVDLVAPESTSAEILESEGLPEVAWWEPEEGSAPTDDPEP